MSKGKIITSELSICVVHLTCEPESKEPQLDMDSPLDCIPELDQNQKCLLLCFQIYGHNSCNC